MSESKHTPQPEPFGNARGRRFMSSFTPGPWTFARRAQRIYGGQTNEVAIAQIGINQNWEANARLIAAAPDLLEALRPFMPFGDPAVWEGSVFKTQNDDVGIIRSYDTRAEITKGDFKRALSAISKAEGRS